MTDAQFVFLIHVSPSAAEGSPKSWPEVVRDLSHNEQQRMNGLDGFHGHAIPRTAWRHAANSNDRVDTAGVRS